MTQAGAKGPAAPARPPAIPPAKGVSPAAPAVTPKAPVAAHHAPAAAHRAAPAAHTPASPKAAAPLAPKAPKGPPPLPPESGPDVGARGIEPMRARLDTSPGMGAATAAETPRNPPVQSREEIQELVRAAVANGVAAVLAETQRLVQGLERRIDELERRPVAVAPPPPAAAAPAPPVAAAHPPPTAASSPQPAARPQPLAAVSAIPVHHALPSLSPTLDIAKIEREVHVEIDSALDGGRRKRRLVVVTVLFILLLFGGLFAMLAQSYSRHG